MNKDASASALPIARYQGSSEWGKFGILHFFTILKDFNSPHKLVEGTTVTSKIVSEIGGQFDLTNIKKGDLVYKAVDKAA